MEYSLFIKLAAEFVGTAVLMVFGNGAVANAELKNTKGYHAGWLNIAMGYGFGVMFPVLMFGGVSGAHINPAMTLAQAINGMFPWGQVLPYIIAQLLGAVVGQLIVYITYWPHYKDTEDANAILGTFCTTDAHNDRVNYFVNEFFGTLMLVLGALCCLEMPWGKEDHAAAAIVVGFIVWGHQWSPDRKDMGGSSILPCCPLRAESQFNLVSIREEAIRGRRSGIFTLYQTRR